MPQEIDGLVKGIAIKLGLCYTNNVHESFSTCSDGSLWVSLCSHHGLTLSLGNKISTISSKMANAKCAFNRPLFAVAASLLDAA